MKKYLTLLQKKEEIIKIVLIAYTIYCAYNIGMSWDEGYHQEIGKINLKYLLSFGLINEPYLYKYKFSTLYWSLSSLISQFFPKNYTVEVFHIINAFFGLMIIVGLYKINKIIFNKLIAKIASLSLFLTPFFFGHLAINNKDIILAFAYIWIVYYMFKYTYFKYKFKKKFLLILKISLLSALGTGIQLLFLGSLIPIVIIFLTIILLNKFKTLKDLLTDFILFFLLFYLILIIFWVDSHSNIIRMPIELFIKSFTIEVGWPFNLLNGSYFFTNKVPYNYLLINYFYKLPEFIIFLYIISIPVLLFNRRILKNNIKNFKIKIILILLLLIYPSFIVSLIPYPIYDGIRHFLWSAAYLVIIPSITMYLIFLNKGFIYNITKIILSILLFFHIFNFVKITPYHYTYLNYFSGPEELRYQKFENDYWSTSLKELIMSSNLKEDKINFFSCGVNSEIVKIYMKQKYKRSEFTKKEEASYVIMTNRTLYSDKKQSISNCYDEYDLENVAEVKRNGLVLSAIKKIK